MLRFSLIMLVLPLSAALAGPHLPAGDILLRDDITRLADHGVITGPISTWPLAWGPILADIEDYRDVDALPADVLAAYTRTRLRARDASRTGDAGMFANASAASEPRRIRSFEDTPREESQLTAGVSWLGDRFSLDLAATVVASPSDDQDVRADGSAVAVALGNYTLAVSTLERWWGPGWDGSLILSNNARPIPAITLDRNFTDAFDSRWLSWLGPWDLSVMMGQLESDRFVPDARFFGMRFSFRPRPGLEISLSRAAQWCGRGRPCDVDTFVDLFLGKDNVGSSGIGVENEPGNQLAGLDLRWSRRWFGAPFAVYGQFIGEDEAGGFPSRYLGLLGVESAGSLTPRWSYRWFGEFAGTSCDFYASDELFDCAYTSGIYQSGYRYRGRAIGHGLDADARVISAGVVLIDDKDRMIHALVRYGALNRGTLPDSNHSLAPLRREISSVDVSYRRQFDFGTLYFGAGAERLENEAAGDATTDVRLFARWLHSF